jgi:hypothetical protein
MTDLALTPAVRDALTQIDVRWRRLTAELDRIPRDRMIAPGAIASGAEASWSHQGAEEPMRRGQRRPFAFA